MKCGICLITKSTSIEYIKEWVDWYLISIGFDRIWIYDGNDTDEIFKLYADSKTVTVIQWPGSYNQLQAYRDFLKKQKTGEYEKMDWIVNFDDDEFLMIENESVKIKDILKTHKTDSLGVNLLFFGSSGVDKKIGVSQIDNFTKRTRLDYPENKTIKMIAKVDKIENSNEMFTYNVKSLTTNVNGELCSDFQTKKPLDKVLWVNHYFTRSKEEFAAKIARGRADYSDAPKRSMAQLDYIDSFCFVTDERAKIRKANTIK
jgi:hypothetical protein